MHYYDIYPQIVPANTECEIRIHPRFAHSAFPVGEPWKIEVFHAPLAGVGKDHILDAYVWASKDGIPANWHLDGSGDLIVSSFFAGEQEHNLQIFITRNDNPDYLKNYSIKLYSLKEDLYSLRPFKIDTHIHSSGSDGREECRYVAARYREKGFDAIALTDHRKYEPSLQAAEAWHDLVPDFNIIPGEEVHAPDNPVHIVNFGGKYSINDLYRQNEEQYRHEVENIVSELDKNIPEEVRFATASSSWVFKNIRKAGGLAIFAHPYWKMSRTVLPEPLIDAVFEKHDFDAVEIIGGFYREQSEANNFQIIRCQEEQQKGNHFPILAASDSHGTDIFPVNRFNIGNFCGLSTSNSKDAELFNWYYTIVLAKSNKTIDIINAIKNGTSAAVEWPEGNIPHIFGDLRMVKYVSFLLREYFPIHDNLCQDQGHAMIDYLTGDESAQGRLKLLANRVEKRREAFFL